MNEKLKIIVDDKGKTSIWMDGKSVTGIKSFKFESEVDFPPIHQIEFYTQVGGLENKEDK